MSTIWLESPDSFIAVVLQQVNQFKKEANTCHPETAKPSNIQYCPQLKNTYVHAPMRFLHFHMCVKRNTLLSQFPALS